MANKSTGKLKLWLTEMGDKLYDTLATHLPFNFNTIDNKFTELDDKVEDMVIDNLISTETDKALSAKQGKVLKDNIGDLFELETSEKSNLVKAVNEHLAETMPHQIEDITNDKTYRYGLQIQNGVTQIIYEEVI